MADREDDPDRIEDLLRRIKELENKVEELEEGFGIRLCKTGFFNLDLKHERELNSLLKMKLLENDRPQSPELPCRLIAPSPSRYKPLREVSRQGFDKRVESEAAQILKKHNITQGSSPAKKFALKLKTKISGLSPKKPNDIKLTEDEDILICVKAGISWNARRIIKKELYSRGLDIFSPTTSMDSRRRFIGSLADFKWVGDETGNFKRVCF
ncbi:unnamed protein product [Meloidogyne enterolobii]|uniref:Uncharacterized protein n=1 Tax=Meloidogyne enterolobii TaxID=390850 RepID=A0ACB0Y2P0_MELEN